MKAGGFLQVLVGCYSWRQSQGPIKRDKETSGIEYPGARSGGIAVADKTFRDSSVTVKKLPNMIEDATAIENKGRREQGALVSL